ncbi:MAG: excinuclease ABC subunit C [Actinobacteria bacterium 69-20]|nr:excinuclease ABC subunit UvrC [Actinomycetota bacterium]OJV26026.1 MAG: excinuclease ABC subunit C [Actinobacteria bacterium 69-20]
MPDPTTYRPAPGSIPTSPGVYRFRDPDGRVIYVGKAKSLRQRLNSYFADLSGLHPRTAQMVTTAASVEWTVVGTEVEALQLEFNWIKEFDPRFNVKFRDDKSYPELAVTVGEQFPRLQVTRGPHKKGVKYFGPYAHAWAIRETLDLLLRVFPARTCSAAVFRRAQRTGRPCLLAYIGKCSAPCVGWVSEEQHRKIVDDFCEFMSGRTKPLIRRLEREMAEASDALDFERAARLRDDLSAVHRAMEKQAVVLSDGTNADVVGVVGDELEAAVHVFHVRDGRVRGQRGWIVEIPVDDAPEDSPADAPGDHTGDRPGDTDGQAAPLLAPGAALDEGRLGTIVEGFLTQFYGGRAADDGATAVPHDILVPTLPPQAEEVRAWLSALRGSNVRLRVPQRGDKRALAETVTRNAAEMLRQHRLRRASDLTARSAALDEIADTLGMDASPLRIECIDISHVQGTNVVASLVVFEDALPKRSDYRHFAIREHPGDDVASIAEVVRRRLTHGAGGRAELQPTAGINPETGRPRRFAYPPQLLVVDGGAPQVNAAAAVLTDLGITDITVCGLAKRLEEVWLPGQDDPVIFPRSSEALYLLQRLRDEAHRFAITYHRSKRSTAMTASALDAIPGLGSVRRQALMKQFGSVAKIRAATADEIAAVPGIGVRTAETIVAALAEAR